MTADIALFGATGSVGRSIAAALRAQGRSYRVVGRSHDSLAKQFGADPVAELVTWNPDDAASVRGAAEGIATIVYVVGVPYNHFELHPILMRKTLEGAIAAGVQRMVLIGTVYPYGLPQRTPVREDHPRNPHTFKGKMRKAQEDELLEADRAGKIRGTILRLPDFYGPAVTTSYMYSAFNAAVHGKPAQLIAPIDTPHEFMYVPDVGPVVIRLADEPRAYGRWWHFAGPGTITQRDFATRIFAAAGTKPKFIVASKTMLRVLGLFNPILRELVEMHYLLTNPVIMDDSALRQLLGEVHKTSYDDGIRETVRFTRTAAGDSHSKKLATS